MKAGATVWLLPGCRIGQSIPDENDRNSLYLVFHGRNLEYVVEKNHRMNLECDPKLRKMVDSWSLTKAGHTVTLEWTALTQTWKGHFEPGGYQITCEQVSTIQNKSPGTEDATEIRSADTDTITITDREWSLQSTNHCSLKHNGPLSEGTIESIKRTKEHIDRFGWGSQSHNEESHFDGKTGEMNTFKTRDDSGIAKLLSGTEHPQDETPATPKNHIERKPDKAAHEAHKTRAAYLVGYIIETGNAIDRLDDDRNPKNFWLAIVQAQDELLDIYQSELANAALDPDATRVLQSNIAKITRGREFARNAIDQSSAPQVHRLGE